MLTARLIDRTRLSTRKAGAKNGGHQYTNPGARWSGSQSRQRWKWRDRRQQPSVAPRLMVAHGIVRSSLWNVRVEDQRARNDVIAEIVECCASEALFDENRRTVLALLGFDPETPAVSGGYDGEHGLAGLFVRLLQLHDPALLDVAAIVMRETLEAG